MKRYSGQDAFLEVETRKRFWTISSHFMIYFKFAHLSPVFNEQILTYDVTRIPRPRSSKSLKTSLVPHWKMRGPFVVTTVLKATKLPSTTHGAFIFVSISS